MSLETDNTSRDYLYGRLLAIAEHIEARALFLADERRDTNAARQMQRFADFPPLWGERHRRFVFVLRSSVLSLCSMRPHDEALLLRIVSTKVVQQGRTLHRL